jgi:hypothetical protein
MYPCLIHRTRIIFCITAMQRGWRGETGEFFFNKGNVVNIIFGLSVVVSVWTSNKYKCD